MWEAARASNPPYFEAAMNEIKKASVEAYEQLAKIDPKKWTKSAFRPGNNCDELVNNWAEAFNKLLLRARDQPILQMLNTIHEKLMKRLVTQAAKARAWRGDISPKAAKIIEHRESLTVNYITVFNGHARYGVSTANHAWVVDVQKQTCSCGLWQLSGIPCVHGVCVYMAQNKDSRLFVNDAFKKDTQLRIYSHFVEPIRGPTFWPQLDLPTVLPPDMRVLPGRPKKSRKVDANEKREKAEKLAAAKEKEKAPTGPINFKNSRKGAVMHCKMCGGAGHNKKTCPLNEQPIPEDGNVGQNEDGGNKKKGTRKRKASTTSMSQPVQSNREDGTSSTPTAQTQPPSKTRKSKKSKH